MRCALSAGRALRRGSNERIDHLHQTVMTVKLNPRWIAKSMHGESELGVVKVRRFLLARWPKHAHVNGALARPEPFTKNAKEVQLSISWQGIMIDLGSSGRPAVVTAAR